MRRACTVVIGVLLLSGCTSTVTGTPTPKAAGSPLATVLSRVPAADLGDGSFEFGDSVRLRQLAGTDPAVWRFQVNTGASTLSTYAASIVQTIGVDLSAAGSALTVAEPPRSMIVITAGQDASKITAAATRSGWTAGDVLSRSLDLDNTSTATAGISLMAPKIRPIGADVVLSQPDADPTTVTASGAVASSPADQVPGVKDSINCLGDVPTAFGADVSSADPSGWTAAGAGEGGPGTAASVICLGAADPGTATALAGKVRSALDSGRSKRSGQPWKTLLPSAKVEVLPGSPTMVRVTASTATAALVATMLAARDIPGR